MPPFAIRYFQPPALLLLHYFLHRKGRLHRVRHVLQEPHPKWWSPLQQIHHLCRNYRSVGESIKHRASVMEHLSSLPRITGSFDTSQAFILSPADSFKTWAFGWSERSSKRLKTMWTAILGNFISAVMEKHSRDGLSVSFVLSDMLTETWTAVPFGCHCGPPESFCFSAAL